MFPKTDSNECRPVLRMRRGGRWETTRKVALTSLALAVALATTIALGAATDAAPVDARQAPSSGSTHEQVPQHWKILLGREGGRTQTLYATFVRSAEGDGCTGTFSNPARGVVERPLSHASCDEIVFAVGVNAGEYRATLSANGQEALGAYRVDDRSTPFRMERVTAAEYAEAIAGGFDVWRRSAVEQSPRVVSALALRPGMVAADVGAGRGEWAVTLAERLGPTTRVFATEIDASLLADTRRLMAGVGVANVTPVLGGPTDTGLPDDCCDAILLRLVYHEMREPVSMLASLRRALRSEGTIAVIENPGNGGHDIEADRVIAEFTAAGFKLRRRVEEWDVERQYCLLFTRLR